MAVKYLYALFVAIATKPYKFSNCDLFCTQRVIWVLKVSTAHIIFMYTELQKSHHCSFSKNNKFKNSYLLLLGGKHSF